MVLRREPLDTFDYNMVDISNELGDAVALYHKSPAKVPTEFPSLEWLRNGHPPWMGHGDKLIGIVDIGSNGIRFSISDLSPPLARIIPTVLVHRSSISLYDAQFDPKTGQQIPIPDHVITIISETLRQFVVICDDIGVHRDQIHFIATEATRIAKNSARLLEAIKAETNIDVELLEKEEEGQIGALGIASGFMAVKGLVADLGGGSIQISWIVSQRGYIRTSTRGSFSFPYGAAALTKTLEDLQKGKSKDEARGSIQLFREKMVANFRDAYSRLGIPDALVEEAERDGGFRVYLSGGGFRGWGYLLLNLSQSHGNHYPISIINGYTAGRDQFEDTKTIENAAKAAHEIFRVSDRRRSQVPAVAFLINALAEAIPLGIKEAHFCQGGVREGYLFRQLSSSIRQQAPLEVATRNFAPGSTRRLQELIESAIPKPSTEGIRRFPPEFGDHVIKAFANVMYVHMFMSKETASTTALYSTSTGILSSTHGVSHQDRSRLALMLQARYRGELPPREVDFRDALRSIISPEDVWWAQYLGRVGFLITRLYPGGTIDASKPVVLFSSEWSWDLGKKKNKEGLILRITLQKVQEDPARFKRVLGNNIKKVMKAGKKKNWVYQEKSWGMKVDVRVAEEGIFPDST